MKAIWTSYAWLKLCVERFANGLEKGGKLAYLPLMDPFVYHSSYMEKRETANVPPQSRTKHPTRWKVCLLSAFRFRLLVQDLFNVSSKTDLSFGRTAETASFAA